MWAVCFLLFCGYILVSTLHCMKIFFPWLNSTDLFLVIYQTGNEKKNEKYGGCSNVSTSWLTGMKGKLRRGSEAANLSFTGKQPDVKLSMLQVNKSWNRDPSTPLHQPSHPSSCQACLQLLISSTISQAAHIQI